jgi:hypothetical protein
MTTLTVLLGACTGTTPSACGGEAPVRMTDLASAYCTNAGVLKATVESTSTTSLFVSLSVDRRLASGEWEEYVADMSADEPFPWKVVAFPLSKGQSRVIEWQPPHRPTGDPLPDGTYRVVAYATRSDHVQGQRHVLAEFSVVKEACNRSPGPSGVRRSIPVTDSEGIRIEVLNSANHRSVDGARVFVLSEQGKELASASTDHHGMAHLPDLGEGDHAKYVVVEHPAFFLSGMRWQAGLREYHILATVLTVR